MFPTVARARTGVPLRLGVRGFHGSATSYLFKKTDTLSPVPQPLQPANADPDSAKFDRHPILKRIPRYFRPYATRFITAPVSHVTAFIILHELTAVVPLAGIWYVLHQHHDLLMASTLDLPAWALEKGTKLIEKGIRDYDLGDILISEKIRFIKEGAYAYVIVKALFPVRIAISLLGMPWFAKWFVLPFTKMFSRKPTQKAQPESLPKPDTYVQKDIKKPRL